MIAITVSLFRYPHLFRGMSSDFVIPVREWLSHSTPGAYINDQGTSSSTIRFKTQGDADKFKSTFL